MLKQEMKNYSTNWILSDWLIYWPIDKTFLKKWMENITNKKRESLGKILKVTLWSKGVNPATLPETSRKVLVRIVTKI